jgi:hypothetical protein
MGYASRLRDTTATMLQGFRAVVDVQHLYRPQHPGDMGAVFTLADHTHTTEGRAAVLYGASIVAWLRARGAEVLTNDSTRGILIGPYSVRNRAAGVFRAHAYLACHVNAGGGNYSRMAFMSMSLGARLAPYIGRELKAAFPMIVKANAWALGSSDRGAVCIERVPTTTAAVLCEPFFGDTPAHQPMLAAPALWQLGAAIAAGVAAWVVEWWRDTQDRT